MIRKELWNKIYSLFKYTKNKKASPLLRCLLITFYQIKNPYHRDTEAQRNINKAKTQIILFDNQLFKSFVALCLCGICFQFSQ